MTTGCDLHGLKVLVTRPQHQAQSLRDALLACGAKPVLFPTIEIRPAANIPAQLAALAQYDDLIFVSVNAVAILLQHARPHAHQRLIAIGAATKAALAEHQLPVSICPEQADSEALLEDASLAQMQGRRVLIVRGQDGRDLLATTLRQRGATVEYAHLYTRLCPQTDCSTLLQRWSEQVDVITVTSNAILDNLLQLCGASKPLLATPILVISARGAEQAAKRGFTRILQAQGASTDAIIDCLCASFG